MESNTPLVESGVPTITEQLKEAIDLAIRELPEKERKRIAQYILSLLEEYTEEKEWDAIVNRPGFLEKMEKLMHESLASGAEGGGFCP
jgi:ribosomal 50S subunit-associated protein YjgA (DUF615 family)